MCQTLVDELQHGNYERRRKAVKTLGDVGGPQAVEQLILTVQHDDAALVRGEAAWALGKIGDVSAFESLVGALSDEHSKVCRSAAEALGQLGDRRAVEPLITSLSSYDAQLRRCAVGALGQLRDPRAIGPLGVMLHNDPDFETRRRTAIALGNIGDAQAIPLLIALITNTSEHFWFQANNQFGWIVISVGYAAVVALEHIGTPEALEALAAWKSEKSKSLKHWWRFWEKWVLLP